MSALRELFTHSIITKNRRADAIDESMVSQHAEGSRQPWQTARQEASVPGVPTNRVLSPPDQPELPGSFAQPQVFDEDMPLMFSEEIPLPEGLEITLDPHGYAQTHDFVINHPREEVPVNYPEGFPGPSGHTDKPTGPGFYGDGTGTS